MQRAVQRPLASVLLTFYLFRLLMPYWNFLGLFLRLIILYAHLSSYSYPYVSSLHGQVNSPVSYLRVSHQIQPRLSHPGQKELPVRKRILRVSTKAARVDIWGSFADKGSLVTISAGRNLRQTWKHRSLCRKTHCYVSLHPQNHSYANRMIVSNLV